jgi:hypothetical protein
MDFADKFMPWFLGALGVVLGGIVVCAIVSVVLSGNEEDRREQRCEALDGVYVDQYRAQGFCLDLDGKPIKLDYSWN